MFGGSLKRGRATRATDSEGWYFGQAAAGMATLHGYREVSSPVRLTAAVPGHTPGLGSATNRHRLSHWALQ